jgi:signal transduction histidine kinase/HAMP domain-containing protein
MRSHRPRSLRRAADAIFALISLLPLLLFTFFMWHFNRLGETIAQVGVLLAVVIALLGFTIFRQLVDYISDRILDLNRVVEGQAAESLPATTARAGVPGLGPIAEIGDIANAFSGMLRELRASTERLEDLVFKLGTLNDMVEMAARIPKIEDLLAHVLERTMRAVSATIGSIMLLDRERQVLRIAVGRGLGDHEHSRPQVEVKVGEGIAGRVVQMGEAVLVEDIEKDPRFGRVNDPRYGGGSFICMPLRVGDRIVGVVNLARKESAGGVASQVFTTTDLQFLNALMTYTAYAVDNARLFEEARAAAQRLEEVVEDQKLRLTLAQQQMLQAAKLSALGELVAGVAHELNNPLTVILGTADMIAASAPAAVREHVQLMRQAIDAAQHVVRGLLTFGRQMPLEKAPVDVAALVDQVLALTLGELNVAEVKVHKDVEPALPAVWADANQLQQVLVNLINNAKQAMAELEGRRQLTLSVHRVGERVRIQVEDTGPGIPADTLPKVFDPFMTTKSDGTGLGLSISYGIIREHGGTLTAENAPEGGALFTIELPIDGQPPPAPDA